MHHCVRLGLILIMSMFMLGCEPSDDSPGMWLGVFGIRLAALGAAVVLAIGAGANPVALVIGLSMVMPAVVIDAWRNRPEVIDQPDYPVPPPDDPAWDRFSVWRFGAMDEATERDSRDER